MQTINLVDLAQFSISLIGSSVNVWMLILACGDLRWMKDNGVNGPARRQQRGRIRQEGLRFTAQLVLLWAAIVALALRPPFPATATHAFQVVAFNRSGAIMAVSILLALKSVLARFDREAVENWTGVERRHP